MIMEHRLKLLQNNGKFHVQQSIVISIKIEDRKNDINILLSFKNSKVNNTP